MLSDILLIILTAYLIASPYFYFKAIKFGMKLVDKPEEAAEEPFFHIPDKKETVKMTPQQQRDMQILANIDRYDGTSNGQIKVKRAE